MSPMARLLLVLPQVAQSSANVVIRGEPGSGKRTLAERLHGLSPAADHPMRECTGTTKLDLRAGPGDTVLLHHIERWPLRAQTRLLDVPRGARLVATTCVDLFAQVQAGRFRSDLLYRLHELSLVVPPLRERPLDIVWLAETFIRDASERVGRRPPALSDAAKAWLEHHPWPGNVRELATTLERAVCQCGELLEVVHVVGAVPAPPEPLDDERSRIVAALARCGGNQTRAAKALGIARNTLIARLDKHGIPRPQKPHAAGHCDAGKTRSSAAMS